MCVCVCVCLFVCACVLRSSCCRILRHSRRPHTIMASLSLSHSLSPSLSLCLVMVCVCVCRSKDNLWHNYYNVTMFRPPSWRPSVLPSLSCCRVSQFLLSSLSSHLLLAVFGTFPCGLQREIRFSYGTAATHSSSGTFLRLLFFFIIFFFCFFIMIICARVRAGSSPGCHGPATLASHTRTHPCCPAHSPLWRQWAVTCHVSAWARFGSRFKSPAQMLDTCLVSADT